MNTALPLGTEVSCEHVGASLVSRVTTLSDDGRSGHSSCLQQDPLTPKTLLEIAYPGRRGRECEEAPATHSHRGYTLQNRTRPVDPPLAPVCLFIHIMQDPTIRYRIWKILLRVTDLPAKTFLEYVARGPCEVREKIRNDTFRCASLLHSISRLSPDIFWNVLQYAGYGPRIQGARARGYARPPPRRFRLAKSR